jgi:hypothetical protein
MARPAQFAVGIALGAHIALAWVGSRLPRPFHSMVVGPSRELIEVQIDEGPKTKDSETEAPKASDSPRATDPSQSKSDLAPRVAARTDARETSTPGDAVPSPAQGEPSEPATGEPPREGRAVLPPDDYDTPPPLEGGGPLGLGWMVPSLVQDGPAEAAPTKAPAARKATSDDAERALSGTLATRDKKVGITVPGAAVVASAVNEVARSVAVPHNTRATFEVKLSRDGRVAYSKVVSNSGGDAAAWDAAAKAVASQLAAKKLDMGGQPSAEGAIVRVSVTQKHVFPTGSQRGANIKPVCANGILNEIVDATNKQPAKPAEGTVPLFQDEFGRPCVPVGVGGIADVSNFGAQKQVQIQSTFTVTTPGELALPTDVHAVNTDAPWIERGKEGPRPTLPQKVRKRIQDKEKRK